MEKNSDLQSNVERREVGGEAVWSLSSAKPGNGVDQIRDGNFDTYWQSDGSQPHLINIQFHKKQDLEEVALYLDSKLDESYTPKKICVKAGSTFHDLFEIETKELDEPCGWVTIPLFDPHKMEDGVSNPNASLRARMVQICIISMHQNGRDTHVRQCRVFGPKQRRTYFKDTPNFSSEDFASFSFIR